MTLGSARIVALLAYLGVVASATLLWAPNVTGLSFGARLSDLLHPHLRGSDLIDAIRNVMLFLGWGLIWVLTAPQSAATRRLIVGATLTAALTSLSMELGQLFFTSRTASLVDVATNTFGGAAGAVLTVAFLKRLASTVTGRSYFGFPAWLLGGSYAMAAAGETLLPLFRQRLAPGAWGSPAHRMRAVLDVWAGDQSWSLPLTDLLLFMPVGFFAVMALVEAKRSYRSAAGWVAAVGVIAAFGLEFGHGFLGVPIRMGAAVVHAVAIALGAALCVYGLPRASRRWRGAARARVALLTYVTVLLLWLTRPYRLDLDPLSIRMKLSYPWLLPLGDARYRADLFAAIDVLNGFLLFLPLGALLAVWPLRLRGFLATVWPAVLFAFVLEASQFVVYLRVATVTDPLVQSAAVAIGWAAVRRVGFRPYGALLPGGAPAAR